MRDTFLTNLLTDCFSFFSTECLLNIYMLTSSHNNTQIAQWYDSCPLLKCWWGLLCKVQYGGLWFWLLFFFLFILFWVLFSFEERYVCHFWFLGKSFASADVVSYCLLLIVNCCGTCQDILTLETIWFTSHLFTNFLWTETLCTL